MQQCSYHSLLKIKNPPFHLNAIPQVCSLLKWSKYFQCSIITKPTSAYALIFSAPIMSQISNILTNLKKQHCFTLSEHHISKRNKQKYFPSSKATYSYKFKFLHNIINDSPLSQGFYQIFRGQLLMLRCQLFSYGLSKNFSYPPMDIHLKKIHCVLQTPALCMAAGTTCQLSL